MSSTIFRASSASQELSPEWNVLMYRNPVSPPFIRFEWPPLWRRIVGKGELCLVTVSDEAVEMHSVSRRLERIRELRETVSTGR